MSEAATPVVVWLRDDLRIADNPALAEAAKTHRPVLAVYVYDDSGIANRPLGAASRWWLHHSLASLGQAFERLGGRLVLRHGDAEHEVAAVLRQTGAKALGFNRRYAPAEREQDDRVERAAAAAGVAVRHFAANLLFEPGEVLTGDGTPYSVFTPFWRAAVRRGEPRAPHPSPSRLTAWSGTLHDEPLEALRLLPTRPDWAAGLRDTWTPGEEGAAARLDAFVHAKVGSYATDRDRPGVEGSSRLSPHLRFGEISPFQVWHRVAADTSGGSTFLSELGWREFDWHLLAREPELATVNVHRQFDRFEWNQPATDVLETWHHGRTGVPIVDAGMRQLWQTGWMHNRVRMITASFLVKNLRLDWRLGEQWFWDTLVDADPANNPAQWQWVAGSGADAAPYFRVFNPVTQARKFDPDGDYVHRWVPELAESAGAALFEPWNAKGDLVAAAEGTDADGYPDPVVDLAASRQQALDEYARMRG